MASSGSCEATLALAHDDSRFVVGLGAGRSGSEAQQVVMQVRGERSSLLGHALCTTKRRASEGQNGISYVV